MKPYKVKQVPVFLGFTVLVTLLASARPASTAAGSALAATPGPRLASEDSATKAGLNYLYNLDYDKALAEFEHARAEHPKDPFAVNHVLQAVLLKELYRLNAVDMSTYSNDAFLTGKPLAADPKVKQRLDSLADEALQLSGARLRANPNDVDALYARGVTRGLRLTYLALVEKSFFSSLRNAFASRNDHEQVLKLDPNYANAKLIVGIHNFVIGSMPFAAKMLVGIVGVSGSKRTGIDDLTALSNDPRAEASVDARVTLALFLRRESRLSEAIPLMRGLSAQFPRNYIFSLDEADMLKDSGQCGDAIPIFEHILDDAMQGHYGQPHLERVHYGLAECLKFKHDSQQALDHYRSALIGSAGQNDLRARTMLGAGEMEDALGKRDDAVSLYEQVLSEDPGSAASAAARRFAREAFHY